MAGSPLDDDVSRRGFLVRAGQIGAAMSVATPTIQSLLASPSSPHALANGVIREVPNELIRQAAPVYAGLHWRHLGPYRGGRVDAVCGVHGRPNEFYYGAVNGGVWKSIDAG